MTDTTEPVLPRHPGVGGRYASLLALLAVVGACAPDPRIERVESSLPSVTVAGTTYGPSLALWMDSLRIPGVSIAVIDDYRVVWAKGYGMTDVGTPSSAVTATTLFQAASVSKLLTALSVLHFVERGVLDLDADLGGGLNSWSLPREAGGMTAPVTLRALLAHTAGIRAGGFSGYERGAPLPTTVQILKGEEPAANTAAILDSPPDEGVAYSGLGYTIVELALIERVGKPFADLMADAVLSPLRMRNSTFEQELPQRLAERAAHGHHESGAAVHGLWRVYPELAAAGLWTTPSDLAAVAIDIAKAWSGRAEGVISPRMAKRMLTPQREQMGLGLVVRPTDTLGFFAHSGGNLGYRAHVEMFARLGKGVVVMTNSDAGQLLVPLVTAAVARAYEWPDANQRQLSPGQTQRIAVQLQERPPVRMRVRLPGPTLRKYEGRFELTPGFDFIISPDTIGRRLWIRLGDQSRLPAYPEANGDFFFEAVDAQISFVSDRSGRVTALRLQQGGRSQEAKRLPPAPDS